MGDYAHGAEFYDVLYGEKDYRAESERLARLIRDRRPEARRILDVGCGTGEHARRLTKLGFLVDGVDLEPAFVEMAAAKCPQGRFRVADMTALELPERYDVVVSLFSAIGYVRTVARLNQTVSRLAAHLEPNGLLAIDPWFEPGKLTHGWVMTVHGEREELKVVRMSRTLVDGAESTLEFEYLVGRAEGIERRSEKHVLGLFTQAEMEEAFAAAGLDVERLPETVRDRGLYLGWPTA